MGTIRKGVNGGFSGKAGSVIGGNWRDVDYIRGLPRLSGKPATLKQLEQRARFMAAVKFLHPLKQLLNLGYKTANTGRATGYNLALHQVIKNAIIGDYPTYTIDYPKVELSRGGLKEPIDAAATLNEEGGLSFTWLPLSNDLDSKAGDTAIIVIYNTQKQLFMYNLQKVERSVGAATMDLPASFLGDTVETWMFFTSVFEDKISKSVYVGSVPIV